ncbi:MAG TPA: hypothetical protein VFM77_03305 [Terriglobales bacterium]|nr:hypothetical protein [Terriglobales bacterium]
MTSHWTTWILIGATIAWLLLLRRLDLLLVVAPAAAVLSYATARMRKSRQNRM